MEVDLDSIQPLQEFLSKTVGQSMVWLQLLDSGGVE